MFTVGGGSLRIRPLTVDGPLASLSNRGFTPFTFPSIGGFVIPRDADGLNASASKQLVLVRAVGPGLVDFGVPSAAPDPGLKLFDAIREIDANDDWQANDAIMVSMVDAVTAVVGAFPLADGSADAALVAYLLPGNYTAHGYVKVVGEEGEVLVEVYAVP
jgi:hypothetical protein